MGKKIKMYSKIVLMEVNPISLASEFGPLPATDVDALGIFEYFPQFHRN